MKDYEEKFIHDMTEVTAWRDGILKDALGHYRLDVHDIVMNRIKDTMNSYRAKIIGIERDYLDACIKNLKTVILEQP